MKNKLLLLLLVLSIFSLRSKAQMNIYSSTSGEWIFSFANVKDNGAKEGTVLRFSPVFNFQNWVNFDVSEHFGFFTGLSVRNVGFIYDVPKTATNTENIRKKFRTYNIGIPVGFKIGKMDKACLFAGYEIEFPLNYKEKTFKDEVKTDKFNVWFSNRVPSVYHTVMVGIQFPYGTTLKFKYYLTNFFNKGFTATDATTGASYQPYGNMDVNVFYVSLSFGLFKNTHPYYMKPKSGT